MRYHNGRKIQIGDVVWINEGSQIGKVAEILDDANKAALWELKKDERGVFFCLDPSKDEMSIDLYYSEKFLEDEGIEPLSRAELDIVDKLVRIANIEYPVSERHACALSFETQPNDDHCWIVSILNNGETVKELMFSSDLSRLNP